MIRLFLLLLCLSLNVSFARNIDTEIQNTSKRLKTFDKDHRIMNTKMAKNAKAILKQQRTVLQQTKELQTLEKELKEKENAYQTQKKELTKLKQSSNKLNEEQQKIEQALVFAVARNASLMAVLDKKDPVNELSLITQETLKALSQQIHHEIQALNSNYFETTKKIKRLEERIQNLHSAIAMIDSKKQTLLVLKRSTDKSLALLEKKQQQYKNAFKKLQDQQRALRKTLTSLNIIKEKEKERIAREKRERREAQRLAKLEQERQKALKSGKKLPAIKKQSIFHSVKTKRYRGKKTIAPLSEYTLIKKFGPYTDPIYDIKTFNESVSLKPKSRHAKVKSVLNGKVILAKGTPLLDNVVIIEHANGMHTIYAYLTQIAPTIKKGTRLKKGSVIGRVNKELMFEVTQQNYHIDPMQLIH